MTTTRCCCRRTWWRFNPRPSRSSRSRPRSAAPARGFASPSAASGSRTPCACCRSSIARALRPTSTASSSPPAVKQPPPTLPRSLAAEDPGAFIAEAGRPLISADTLLASELDRLSGAIAVTSYTGAPAVVRDALARATRGCRPALDRARAHRRGRVVAHAGAERRRARRSSTMPAASRRRSSTRVAAARASTAAAVDVSLGPADAVTADRPRSVHAARSSPCQAFERDAATGRRASSASRSAIIRCIVDFNDGLGDVGHRAHRRRRRRRSCRSAEIVARHQQARAAQDRLLASYVASVRMQQHFRPTSTDPGFDVVTENRYFADREGVEWEELSFSVNGTKWGPDRPPFPLLQPEKVLSPPLDLRADQRLPLSPRRRRRGRRRPLLRRPLRARGARRDPLSRHGVDRRRDVPPRQAAGDADGAVGAGRLERGGGALRRRGPRRRP